MKILFILVATLGVAFAEAPLSVKPYPATAPVYGPPQIIEPVAPYPPAISAPVYGPPPQVYIPPPIESNFAYEVYTPKPVKVVAPYQAPIIKPGPYPTPVPIGRYPSLSVKPVISTYNYEVPAAIAAAPVYGPPAPVYGPPLTPAPVYGPLPSKVYLPAPKPILTSYNYPIYTPQPIVKTLGPYPAPTPAIVHIPEGPSAPHSEYGAPLF